MVVDTSALVAIYLEEREHRAFEGAIDQAPAAFLSVVSRVELTAVLSGGRVAATPRRWSASSAAWAWSWLR